MVTEVTFTALAARPMIALVVWQFWGRAAGGVLIGRLFILPLPILHPELSRVRASVPRRLQLLATSGPDEHLRQVLR